MDRLILAAAGTRLERRQGARWLLVAAIVMLGVELRLDLTG